MSPAERAKKPYAASSLFRITAKTFCFLVHDDDVAEDPESRSERRDLEGFPALR